MSMIVSSTSESLTILDLYKLQDTDGILSRPLETGVEDEIEEIEKQIRAKVGDDLFDKYRKLMLINQDKYDERCYSQGFKDAISIVLKNI